MIFSLRYFDESYRTSVSEEMLNSIGEIQIRFNPTDSTLKDFIELHQEQRIILYFEKTFEEFENFFTIYKALKEKFAETDIVMKFDDCLVTDRIFEKYGEEIRKYPFFFSGAITSWSEIEKLLAENVSDILIAEELGFQIADVSHILHKAGVKLRVFPDVAQDRWDKMPGHKKFFIRPEDVDVYAEYVDVMEIYRTKSVNTIYDIYTKDKEWYGDLDELILSLNESIDNRNILSSFAGCRLNCGRRCLKGHPCSICDRIVETAAVLNDKGLIIERDLES